MKTSNFFPLFSFLLFFAFQFSNAQEPVNQVDKNGKHHGVYKKYYDNGNLRYEGSFDHGKEIGVFKFYAASGEKHPVATKEYYKHTDSIAVKYYSLQGVLESEGKMVDKNREGLWNYYFPDGKTIMSTENYKQNLLDGEIKIFFKDGKLAEISHYKAGKLNGNLKRYGDDGKPREDITYLNGIAHGPTILYDENGEEYAKGNYENGFKAGIWDFKMNGIWISTEDPDKEIGKQHGTK